MLEAASHEIRKGRSVTHGQTRSDVDAHYRANYLGFEYVLAAYWRLS